MLFLHNKIASRTPGKAGNTGHGPEYHKPPPVDDSPERQEGPGPPGCGSKRGPTASQNEAHKGEDETIVCDDLWSRAGRKCEPSSRTA